MFIIANNYMRLSCRREDPDSVDLRISTIREFFMETVLFLENGLWMIILEIDCLTGPLLSLIGASQNKQSNLTLNNTDISTND